MIGAVVRLLQRRRATAEALDAALRRAVRAERERDAQRAAYDGLKAALQNERDTRFDVEARLDRVLKEEMRQRRRAIVGLEINRQWVDVYRLTRAEPYRDVACRGQALDAIRLTDDDDVARGVLTDIGGLLPDEGPVTILSGPALVSWRARVKAEGKFRIKPLA